MKKNFLPIAVLLLLFACQKEETAVSETEDVTGSLKTVAITRCASQQVLQQQLAADPKLRASMDKVEAFTGEYLRQGKNLRLVNGKIQIPVVVNVLYRTAAENISAAQIQSQIDVLNRDFQALNPDYSQVPALFAPVKAKIDISFVLDATIYKLTTKTSWGTNDACKKATQGGLNPTSPTTKLNLWVATIGGGILGYAQFPGGSSATDGVVIDSKYFGTTGSASSSYPYNLGRTATHEVGHWMNLRHIWGDATCGSDLVNDTPQHNTSNFGVPTYPHYSTCTGKPVEMTMNYMDYTDDRGMYMFSLGQKARIDAIFAVGGSRSSFR